MKLLLPLLATTLLSSALSTTLRPYSCDEPTAVQPLELASIEPILEQQLYEVPANFEVFYITTQDEVPRETWEPVERAYVPEDSVTIVDYVAEGQIPSDIEVKSAPALGVGIHAVLGAAEADGKIKAVEEYYLLQVNDIQKEIVDGNVNYHFDVVFANGSDGRIYATFTTEEDSQTGEIRAKTARINVGSVVEV